MGASQSASHRKDVTVSESGDSPITRNIILFGKTGSGKATIANVIFGIDSVFRVSTSVEGVTRSAGNSRSLVQKRLGASDITYVIKLVDTVEESGTNLCTRHILNAMNSFAKSVQGGIHLVLFVFKHGRFTNEDKNAFDFIIMKFKQDIPIVSALVITRCEELDDPTRKQVVTEFQTEKSTAVIAEEMKKGILTVGFPNLSAVKEDLRPIYEESMKIDADKLRKLVAEATTGIPIPPRLRNYDMSALFSVLH